MRLSLLTAGAAALSLTYVGHAAAVPYTYSTFAVPGAHDGTYAQGINDSGEIAGYSLNASIGYSGFVQSGGTTTTIQDPNAVAGSTFVYGISNAGAVVGTYGDGSGAHAFVESGGTYTTLSALNGYFQLQVQGINNAGQVVGSYFQSQVGRIGFEYSNGAVTSFTVPGSGAYPDVNPYGINDAGTIVGYYTEDLGNTDLIRGFIDTNGSFTFVDVPNATATVLTGIDDAGDLVGYYGVGSATYAFTDVGGVITTLNVPNAAPNSTLAFGINDLGDVTGHTTDTTQSGGSLGFEAVPATAVSEPATASLVVAGLAALSLGRRRLRA
jgi:hypothetical protein